MLYIPLLLGRTGSNDTEGPSHRSQCLGSQSISMTCHFYSSRPLLTFPTCLPLLLEELFPYPQLKIVYVVLHISAKMPQAWGLLALYGKISGQEWAFMYLCVCRPWAVPSTPWERTRGDHHVAFLTACVFSHACCSGTPAASRCSQRCSTTILKNCFGFIVGWDIP